VQVTASTSKQTAMAKTLQLTIPNACHENWHTMAEVEKGRYCLSCRKNVIDFTNMSDHEILQHITSSSGNVCGRLHADQMNRNMTLQREGRLSWFKYFLRFTLPAFFISMKAEAQEVKKPEIEQTDSQKQGQKSKVEITVADEWTVKGRVLVEDSIPIFAATVTVKGTYNSTITDARGYFKLVLPNEMAVDLVVATVGYEMIELRAQPSKDNAEISINMIPSKVNMEVIVIAGSIRIKPRPPKRSPLEIARSIITPDSVKIFPNPIGLGNDIEMELKINKPGDYYVEVTDFSGRLVIEKEVQANAKLFKAAVNTKQLLAGRYIVCVRNSEGKKIGVKKIIVQ
jgi:hypothetical protein